MNKFEQLIEYVINDEEQKAHELFHEIVVEKSRQIYEDLMQEEAEEEVEGEEESEEELDEAMHDEEMDENIGGDAADDLMADVEMEEEGLAMEADDDMTDMDVDAEESGEDLEDRVVDLEDKLDELMAEFEAMMGDSDEAGDGDDFEADAGGDALEMDDTEEMIPGEEDYEADEEGEEEGEEEAEMMEAVSLDKAPAPKTSEESFVNKKSTVAANSGQTGMEGRPVKMTGDIAQGRPTPKSDDLPMAGKYKNVPGRGTSNSRQDSAPKPVTSQASGVNTKTPFPKA